MSEYAPDALSPSSCAGVAFGSGECADLVARIFVDRLVDAGVDHRPVDAVTPIGEHDQQLPGEHASYYLEAGFGPRRNLLGHLSTALLTAAESNDLVDMRVIEGGRDAAMPALRHEATHVFLYILDGLLALTLDGKEHHLASGDCANVPAASAYATRVVSGAAHWIASSSDGSGATLWDAAGIATPTFCYAVETDLAADRERIGALSGIDATPA